eukprot:1120949-Rhodomonas_salina.2
MPVHGPYTHQHPPTHTHTQTSKRRGCLPAVSRSVKRVSNFKMGGVQIEPASGVVAQWIGPTAARVGGQLSRMPLQLLRYVT